LETIRIKGSRKRKNKAAIKKKRKSLNRTQKTTDEEGDDESLIAPKPEKARERANGLKVGKASWAQREKTKPKPKRHHHRNPGRYLGRKRWY